MATALDAMSKRMGAASADAPGAAIDKGAVDKPLSAAPWYAMSGPEAAIASPTMPCLAM